MLNHIVRINHTHHTLPEDSNVHTHLFEIGQIETVLPQNPADNFVFLKLESFQLGLYFKP